MPEKIVSCWPGCGFSRQIEASAGEEAVPAPIDTASDAFGELVDDGGSSKSCLLMRSRDAAWIAAASTADQHTTQQCTHNTELIKHTSAAQRQGTTNQKA